MLEPAVAEKMEEAAEVARLELAELLVRFPEAVMEVGAWVMKHKGGAGWKRLARQLGTVAGVEVSEVAE